MKPILRFILIALLTYLSQLSFAQGKAPKYLIEQDLRDLLLETIADSKSFEDKYEAEVWYVGMSERLKPFIKDPQKRMAFLRKVHRYSLVHEVQPSLVLAVIEVESRFDQYAVSRVGAQGVMQVMPFWKKEIGRPDDNLIDLETNLKYGITILRHYLDREKGRWPEALARYNGSYGSYRYSIKVMDAWERRWK